MKAAICPRYGPPEVVEIREVPKPVQKPGEVLIRSTFPFEDVIAAHRRADSHRKTGSVVLTVAPAGA